MSYKASTDLGHLRELLGDTDPDDELFSDEYLQSLIDRYGANGTAASIALYRVVNDPKLLLRRYRKFGPVSQNDLATLQRTLLEEIERIRLIDSPKSSSFSPAPNQTGVGRSTDEEGWYQQQSIDDYLRGK